MFRIVKIDHHHHQSKTVATLSKANFNRNIGGVLGSGSQGEVRSFSFPSGILTSADENENGWIIKRSYPLNIVNIANHEDEILAKYHQTFKVENQRYKFTIGKLTIDLGVLFSTKDFITEKMPGKLLSSIKTNTLSLSGVLSLANAISSELNQYHYYRIKTGCPIIYGDIKAENIMVDMDCENNKVNSLNFIDFGISMKTDGNPDKLKTRFGAFNPIYFPLEASITGMIGLFGMKTDIYMLGMLLKKRFFNKSVLSELKQVHHILPQLVSTFNGNMTHPFYFSRPNTTEVVHFFNLLENINHIKLAQDKEKHNDYQCQFNENLAKLILLANGWKEQFISENNMLLQNDPDFSKAIISLYEDKKLNKNNVNNLIRMTNNSVVDNLDLLTQLTGNVHERRQQAFLVIQYAVVRAKNTNEINELKDGIINLAKNSKIDYLFKRQGIFTFSIHSHEWNGMKVSETWLDVMKMFDGERNNIFLGRNAKVSLIDTTESSQDANQVQKLGIS